MVLPSKISGLIEDEVSVFLVAKSCLVIDFCISGELSLAFDASFIIFVFLLIYSHCVGQSFSTCSSI